MLRRYIIIDKFDLRKFRVNEQIRAEKVRLVGEEGGVRIVTIKDALQIAREQYLDLVEISPNQDPPVVRVVDFSKFRFEQIKKAKVAKKKQKVIHVKEIRMRPAIDPHDYEHKVKHAVSFLEKGDKVKFTVRFKGREIIHKDLGMKVMDNIQKDLEHIATIEKKPSMEGRNIIMVMAPASSGSHKAHKAAGGEDNPRIDE